MDFEKISKNNSNKKEYANIFTKESLKKYLFTPISTFSEEFKTLIPLKRNSFSQNVTKMVSAFSLIDENKFIFAISFDYFLEIWNIENGIYSLDCATELSNKKKNVEKMCFNNKFKKLMILFENKDLFYFDQSTFQSGGVTDCPPENFILSDCRGVEEWDRKIYYLSKKAVFFEHRKNLFVSLNSSLELEEDQNYANFSLDKRGGLVAFSMETSSLLKIYMLPDELKQEIKPLEIDYSHKFKEVMVMNLFLINNSPNEGRLIAGHKEGIISFWKFSLTQQNYQFLRKINSEKKNQISSLQSSIFNNFLFTNSDDKNIEVYIKNSELSFELTENDFAQKPFFYCCSVFNQEFFSLGMDFYKIRNDVIQLKERKLQNFALSDDLSIFATIENKDSSSYLLTLKEMKTYQYASEILKRTDGEVTELEIRIDAKNTEDEISGCLLVHIISESTKKTFEYEYKINKKKKIQVKIWLKPNELVEVYSCKNPQFSLRICQNKVYLQKLGEVKDDKKESIYIFEHKEIVNFVKENSKHGFFAVSCGSKIYFWDFDTFDIHYKFDLGYVPSHLVFSSDFEFLATNQEIFSIFGVKRVGLFLACLTKMENYSQKRPKNTLVSVREQKDYRISNELIYNTINFACLPKWEISVFEYANLINDEPLILTILLFCWYSVTYEPKRYNTIYKAFINKNKVNEEIDVKTICNHLSEEIKKDHKARFLKKNLLVKDLLAFLKNTDSNETLDQFFENEISTEIFELLLPSKDVVPLIYSHFGFNKSEFLKQYNKHDSSFHDKNSNLLVLRRFLNKLWKPSHILAFRNSNRNIAIIFWVIFRVLHLCTCLIYIPLICSLYLSLRVVFFVLEMIPIISSWFITFTNWVVKLENFNISSEKSGEIDANSNLNIQEIRKLEIGKLFDNEASSEFMAFLGSKQPEDEIFKNYYIRAILNCKWVKTKFDFFVDMLEYFFFVALFTTEALFFMPYRNYLTQDESKVSFALTILILVLSVWNLFREIIQYKKVGKTIYALGGIWNFFDWMVLIFTIPGIILDLINIACSNELNEECIKAIKVLLSTAMIFHFLKLACYARGFEKTSFLIRIFIQVFLDMRYFIVLLFYITLALSFAGKKKLLSI